MAIFNSLGSNYNFKYVKKSLLSSSNKNSQEKLQELLEKKYAGKAILLYKGREAITLALKILGLPEDSFVAINGFTCVAVFNSIRKAGLEPKCLDLTDTGGLNFTAKTLVDEVKKNKKIRVVVIQNTLGFPCEIEKIRKICDENKLILIEDLAHSVGTKYENGKEAGSVGDFVILSFSQDKIIDAVSGGALVIRNTKFQDFKLDLNFQTPKNEVKDRLYPLITYKIRKLYGFRLGKAYHFLLKRARLMSDLMNEAFYEFYSLPAWYSSLALYEFESLTNQLAHRRRIAEIYVESLPEKMFMFEKTKAQEGVNLSSNLRFPIFIENRTSLVKHLKNHSIYLSDIWYTDVAPECPNAVADSKIILNLPTHINISENEALKICDLINKWKQK